jgi:hypothetical protein
VYDLQFGDSDESDGGRNDSEDNLPFPKPISRAAFLAPDFDPATFLSSLVNRHQTLDDLQAELRELSQSLNQELFDLVNENYQDFLSLGTALKGGEEKVEQVRTALLSFQRDIQAIRDQFSARAAEIRSLIDDKKSLRAGIAIGHDLLDLSGRIDTLEQRLMLHTTKEKQPDRTSKPNGAGEAKDTDDDGDGLSDESLDSESEDSSEDEVAGDSASGPALISLRRLERLISEFLSLKVIISRVGETHPFVVNQEDRISAIKSALLLDLNTAVKQSGGRSKEKKDRVVKLYERMGEPAEATAALQQLKI